MEVGKEVVVEGEVVEAGELVELVLVEGGEPAPGQHQVGQLGQGGEGGGLQGEAFEALEREVSEGGEREKFLGREGESWTSLDMQRCQVCQISKIHPLSTTSDEHQSSHPGDSSELKEAGVRLLGNRALDELDRLEVAQLKSCQVLGEVGGRGSRVAPENMILNC